MNIANGGLITKVKNYFFVTDLANYSGTFVFDGSRMIDKIAPLMWFANTVDEKIYYSDQNDNNCLCCFNSLSKTQDTIVKKPCSNLIYYFGYIYYINEEDNCLYSVNIATAKILKVVSEPVICFCVIENTIYFSTPDGLKKLDLNKNLTYKISGDIPICLFEAENKLYYSDKSNNYALTSYDLLNCERQKSGSVMTKSITYKDRFIYVSNAENGLSVERVDEKNQKIRFSGEKTDKLHIIGDYLFFINKNSNNEWFKLHLRDGSVTLAFEG